MTKMTSDFILESIEKKHRTAAVVRELTVWDSWGWSDLSAPHSRRIDALMFEARQRTAIEVKVDRRDVRRETVKKVYPWKAITHRFVYAVPAGLIEAPPLSGCGLWWVHEDGRIEIKKTSKINKYPEPLPSLVVQNIAMRAAGKRVCQ